VPPLPPAGAAPGGRPGAEGVRLLRRATLRALRPADGAAPRRPARPRRVPMTAATAPVALLERAIGWTRRALHDAEAAPPSASTPCHDWQLGDLLAHMSDGLDAFTEASC